MGNLHKIQHVGILTNNHRRLINFYTKRLGCSIEKESVISKQMMQKIFGLPCECTMTLLSNDDAKIEVFWFSRYHFKKRNNKQVGFNHFSFVVKDKVEFCEVLSRKKIPVIKVAKGDRFVYFIKDPDGNRIEIQDYLKVQ